MRLDHIAFRVTSKTKALETLSTLLGYGDEQPFEIVFDDGSKVECFALSRRGDRLAPEMFVSEGEEDSIVGQWVEERGGLGGVHHFAYTTDNLTETHREWKERGVEFTTEEIIECPDDNLRQVFTRPFPELGNLIIELIERGDKGFCGDSVKLLMESTQEQ